MRVLTVFAFSSENWNRPPEEVSGLMELLALALGREVPQLKKDGVRIHIVGDRSGLSEKMRAGLAQAELATAENTHLILNVCFNYGGRWDISQAVNQMLAAQPEKRAGWNEGDLEPHLSMSFAPEPDLFIRTGGEERISNFLLWQLAYTELYFTPTLWPDFDTTEFDKAIVSYQKRERRFGRTSEQLVDKPNA